MAKAFWKSKSVYAAVLVFVGGGLKASGLDALGDALIALGGALGIVGLRLAKEDLK